MEEIINSINFKEIINDINNIPQLFNDIKNSIETIPNVYKELEKITELTIFEEWKERSENIILNLQEINEETKNCIENIKEEELKITNEKETIDNLIIENESKLDKVMEIEERRNKIEKENEEKIQ